MPKYIEERLAREAKKKGLKGKRRSAYIWGTMQRIEKKKHHKYKKRTK